MHYRNGQAGQANAEHTAASGLDTANRAERPHRLDSDHPSDADLVRAVIAALERNQTEPADKIRPVVREGWLTLGGTVEAPFQKRAAEDAISALKGIRGVSNNIQIESDLMEHRVRQKIDEAFTSDARLSAHRISIVVHDHKVILTGCARSDLERDEAEAAAWAVPGVAAVINRIITA